MKGSYKPHNEGQRKTFACMHADGSYICISVKNIVTRPEQIPDKFRKTYKLTLTVGNQDKN